MLVSLLAWCVRGHLKVLTIVGSTAYHSMLNHKISNAHYAIKYAKPVFICGTIRKSITSSYDILIPMRCDERDSKYYPILRNLDVAVNYGNTITETELLKKVFLQTYLIRGK